MRMARAIAIVGAVLGCIAALSLMAASATADNDRPETAQLLEGHNYLTAHLNASDDTKQYWYKLELERGEELFIYFYGTGEPYHRCRMLYSLLGPDSYADSAYIHGEYWYRDRQQNNDFSDLWDWICPDNGTYYLHFFAIGGAVGDFHCNVSMDTPSVIYRFAHDSGTVWWWNVTDLNKYDIWKIWLEATPSEVEGVAVTLAWTGDKNLDLEALDLVDDFEANQLNFSHSYSYDRTEVVRFTPSYTGWYYIRINYNTWWDVEPYDITTREYSAPNDGDNDPANATLVVRTGVFQGHIEASRDMHDWYSFELNEGDLLGVSAQLYDPNHPANNGDTRNFYNGFEIQVYDPHMRRVNNGADTNYAYPVYDTNINNLDMRSSDITVAGIYSVRISYSWSYGWYYDPANTTGHIIAFCDYSLQITIPNKPARINATALEDVLMLEDTTWWEDYAGSNRSWLDLIDIFVDPEGGELAFTAVGDPNITAKLTGSRLTLRPRADWFGDANVTLFALDDSGNRVQAVIRVTVAPVNDRPRVSTATMQLPFLEDDPSAANRTLDLHDLFYDIDPGDDALLTFEMVGGSRLSAVFEEGTGNVTLLAGKDFNGELDVTFTARDPLGLAESARVHVVVEPVNDAPLPRAEGVAVWQLDEGFMMETFDASTLLYDPDGDSGLRWVVRYASASGRDNLSLANEAKDPLNPVIVIMPATGAIDWSGTVRIVIDCVDPGRLAGSREVDIRVANTPDPPTIVAYQPLAGPTIAEGATATFTITTVDDPDPDNANLTYTWSLRRQGEPSREVQNGTSSSYTLDTDLRSEGSYIVSAVVHDATGLACPSPVEWGVTVTKTNRRPSVTITKPVDNATFREGEWVVLEASGTDPDEEDVGGIRYEWYDGEVLLGSGGRWSIKNLKPGDHVITAVITDPLGDTGEATINIKVKRADEGPGPGAVAAVVALATVAALATAAPGRRR